MARFVLGHATRGRSAKSGRRSCRSERAESVHDSILMAVLVKVKPEPDAHSFSLAKTMNLIF